MTAAVIGGPLSKSVARDEEGYRTYKIKHRIKTTDPLDGPQIALTATGLPAIGSFWNFDNDVDAWCFCLPTIVLKAQEQKKNELVNYWTAEQTFTNKPFDRCQTTTIDDPLLEPQKVSGSFVKFQEEAVVDRDGYLILSSSHEQYRGSQVEFDSNKPTVRVEQNVATLDLDVFSQNIDDVNDAILWGLGPRRVKLSNVSWERKYHGVCNIYYTRIFDFDIDYNTFDKYLLDEGKKVLNGHWATEKEIAAGETGWVLDDIDGAPPDPNDPTHFNHYKDRNGENTRVVLDGMGLPAYTTIVSGTATTSNGAAQIKVEKYNESNLLLLGIPSSL